MIKKFVAWVKALFSPAKIDDVKVDEYIAKQSKGTNWERHVAKETQIRFSKPEDRPAGEPLNEGEVIVGVNSEAETIKVVKIEERKVEKPVPTPPKPLNEQLKGVELPSYAKGKTLPPKAKRQFIKQAKASPTPARRLDDTPHSTGGHVTSHGIDPVNAALYGYAAGAILSDDTPSSPAPAPVEECRSSTYSSSSDDSYSSSSYSSSSSSYDSSSYDSGSSYSSCD
ncbi:hypothetical protein POP15_044 [Pectobacterium phage POP15]|nr:hypothetical protein POP15_044 [Pectobacterium phage POP15]